MTSRRTFLAGLALAPLAAVLPRRAVAASRSFPRVPARSLAREDVTLPSAFAGSRNLVLLAPHRSEADQLDSWTAPLTALQADVPELADYRLTLMGTVSDAHRGLVEGALRGLVKEPSAWPRFLLHYGEREAVLAELGARSEAPMALLLDASGDELWRASGVWSEATDASLRSALG